MLKFIAFASTALFPVAIAPFVTVSTAFVPVAREKVREALLRTMEPPTVAGTAGKMQPACGSIHSNGAYFAPTSTFGLFFFASNGLRHEKVPYP